jgi:hypothetical protein
LFERGADENVGIENDPHPACGLDFLLCLLDQPVDIVIGKAGRDDTRP